jgi:nucleotide-binding universal stress UspA family protein
MFMIISAAVLLLIEITIAVEKTKALVFASTVLVAGLTAREVTRRKRLVIAPVPVPVPAIPTIPLPRPEAAAFIGKLLVAVRGGGEKLLRHACEDAKLRNAYLFVLNVKEVAVSGLLPERVPAETFTDNGWMEEICRQYNIPFRIVSILSSEVGYTIAEHAATLGVDRLILGATQRSLVEQALRGDVIRTVSELLPEEIQLIIYRA